MSWLTASISRRVPPVSHGSQRDHASVLDGSCGFRNFRRGEVNLPHFFGWGVFGVGPPPSPFFFLLHFFPPISPLYFFPPLLSVFFFFLF